MIPWMVAGLEPAQTFVELFQQLCAGSVVCLRDYAGRLQDSRLVRAFVGTAKDSLVAVEHWANASVRGMRSLEAPIFKEKTVSARKNSTTSIYRRHNIYMWCYLTGT